MDNQPESQFQQPNSGPQFGMEQGRTPSRGFRGWLNRYGSSVVLPIIALLILAGGIYLYANQKEQEILPLGENEQGIFLDNEGVPVLGEQTVNEEDDESVPTIVFGTENNSDRIAARTEKGEGVTHLARRALKDYLRENPQELSNEQKIYIEDYLKDKVGSRPLEVGEEIGFSKVNIQEAIDASLQLDQQELKNLEPYSALVAW